MKQMSRLQKLAIMTALAAVVLAAAMLVHAQDVRWALVNWKVRHDFPDIRRTTSAEVANWIADKKRTPPVLIDVRTQGEYEVSHLPGGRRVQPGSNADAVSVGKEEPIVTYCSVGYRSAAFAKKLKDAGYTDVQNMTGSIFEWANEGRPIECDGQRVNKVHPYNSTWGKLLKPELRADIPANQTGR